MLESERVPELDLPSFQAEVPRGGLSSSLGPLNPQGQRQRGGRRRAPLCVELRATCGARQTGEADCERGLCGYGGAPQR